MRVTNLQGSSHHPRVVGGAYNKRKDFIYEATKTAVWEEYKFIHVNTVAPFGSFRTKIRKWKKIVL